MRYFLFGLALASIALCVLSCTAPSRIAAATERIAAAGEVTLGKVGDTADSAKRTTEALGNLWDWLKRQAAWVGWAALLSTWPYRMVRGWFTRRRRRKKT